MISEEELRKKFSRKKVLITGGLGFVGSNLALRLVEMGSEITLLDSMLPLYGGNLHNIEPIKSKVRINFADIRDRHTMNYIVQDQNYIFHLAGQVSHVDSILDPFTDVGINVHGTLCVLEACQKHNPSAKILFSGTRGQYGPSVKLPVDENAPTNPKGMYAITNLTAEKMVIMYHEVHKVYGTCLRLTNSFGPRHQMRHNRYGVVNWFIRLALDDKTIPIMGDGRILRDFLYVDDAVNAILVAAASDKAYGQIFNVGSGIPTDFITLAETIIRITGSGRCDFSPFSKERKELEPGDYYTDITKIKNLLDWTPQVELEDGLRRTIDFYRQHRQHYWSPNEAPL